MPYPDAFALKNSGLNNFLFAGVGEELNGSPLTILSLLARLGEDPWAQAARWASLPPAAAADGLAKAIGRMPLAPHALANARATAVRLVLLLPASAGTPAPNTAATIGGKLVPAWVPMMAFFCSLAIALALMTVAQNPGITSDIPPAAAIGAAPGHTAKPASPAPR